MQFNIRRYTVGAGSIAIDPGAGAQWWWGGAIAPAGVWIGGSLAFAGACLLLWFVVRSTRDIETTDPAADGRDDSLESSAVDAGHSSNVGAVTAIGGTAATYTDDQTSR
jgi:hypothetical protein